MGSRPHEFERFQGHHQPGGGAEARYGQRRARVPQQHDPTEQIDVVEAAESHIASPDA